MSIDEHINQILQPVADFLSGIIFYSIPLFLIEIPLILIWLVCAGLVFTLYFGFINLTGFAHAFRIIRGDFSNPKDPGEITHFQALATALSGTVGLGNIAGVAIAISIGGPGATFWMILAGLLGMSTKFIECTLGLKYRRIDNKGRVLGGPMFYLQNGLKQINLPKLGKALAIFFAICCCVASLCGSNMLQSNQAYSQFLLVMGNEDSFWYQKGWLFGLLLAAVIASIIIGGIKSIARVTSRVIPFMAAIYLLAAIFILIKHANFIPDAFGLIFSQAFSPTGIEGGIVGVIIQGFRRAFFSSEAGMGAAAIAHAAATTKEPIREGYVALMEPFIDTVVICTITALVIIITQAYINPGDANGVQLTSNAFGTVIWWFPYVLSIAVLLFAISTMISWAYYGGIAWRYLVGDHPDLENAYKILFCFCTIIGASVSLQSVIALSDSLFFSMGIVNILGLYLLAPIVKSDLHTYRAKYIQA